jgi:phage-related protein
MENVAFLKMDIFFVITTTVVVIFGLLGSVILYYVIKIARGLSSIISTVQKETTEIADDFREVRKEMKEGVKDVREGITTAANYTKMVAGASIVKAVSGLFEAFVEEKEQSKVRKKKAKKKTEE